MELWDPRTYDALRRQLIPSFDLLYQCAADVVAFAVARRPAPPGGRVRVLDLGAGTGLLSAVIRDRLPHCELVLLDDSTKMMAVAERRFAGDPAVRFVRGRLEDPLPAEEYDVVVSALAIHHLPHQAKRKLFSDVHTALRHGGLFVNVEQVSAPTAYLEALYDERHEHHVQVSQTDPAEWAAGRERMKFDICADVQTQLEWLRESGFVHVDCLAKDCRFATYAGWRDGGSLRDAVPAAGARAE